MYFSGKEPRKALKASECPIGVEANETHFVAPVISLQPLLIVDLALARINVLYSMYCIQNWLQGSGAHSIGTASLPDNVADD